MRNTLHNNSRPMKNYKFSLKMGEFKFERDKHIDFFTYDVILESIEKFFEVQTICLFLYWPLAKLYKLIKTDTV